MKFLRLLLFPFSIIYGLVVILRNLLYNIGLLKSTSFNLPVISVGNLAVGGSGKSPMTEYIVGLLKNDAKIATLSRGYGRNTHGFLEVLGTSTALDAGDEPIQFKSKFPDITVAVCENRVTGIETLQASHEVVILDDAFQHRAVKPGLSILLFDYSRFTHWQLLLPAGNLREPFFARKRADILVVTKTPPNLSKALKLNISQRLKPYPHQKLFFSFLEYHTLKQLDGDVEKSLDTLTSTTDVILLTGIANPLPLVEKLKTYTTNIFHCQYRDHHHFNRENIIKLVASFRAAKSADKIIITTEKDAQRLKTPVIKELLNNLPVYYLPVSTKFHKPGDLEFDQIIKNYVIKH